MQIVTMSDPHTFQRDKLFNQWIEEIPNKEESIIVCAGDVSSRGAFSEVNDFLDWYNDLPFLHKIMIAGNHDFIFESEPKLMVNTISELYPSIDYLNDSGVTRAGIKFWGSPIQPWFHNWAFNRYRGEDIKKHWDLIPIDTDILITHGPVYLKGDKVVRGGEHTGCEDLLKVVEEIKPKLHVSGHIHEGYGIYFNEHTTFHNSSILDENYSLVNKPQIYEFEQHV